MWKKKKKMKKVKKKKVTRWVVYWSPMTAHQMEKTKAQMLVK